MPIARFWLLDANISRCEAYEDLRRLSVAASAMGPKGFEELQGQLTKQMGCITVAKPKLDRAGLRRLKVISQGSAGKRNGSRKT